MTRRRLLDAAAIFAASRGVASKHVAFRRHQLDAYGKTSSLAKSVKSQTDRVTLTFKAASALTERFNGPRPHYSTRSHQSSNDDLTPSQNDIQRASEQTLGREGFEQDHFYERPEGTTTAEAPPDGNLEVKQEEAKKHPLPDGSISPAGSFETTVGGKESFPAVPRPEYVKAPFAKNNGGSDEITKPDDRPRMLSSDQAERLQRQAEQQVPSDSAEPPLTATSDDMGSSVDVNQEPDVFYRPSSSTSRSFQGQPPVKLPQHAAEAQESYENVPAAQINQDTFYSPVAHPQEQTVPQGQAVPEQEQLSDDQYSEIFHSPRVARMLGSKSEQDKNSQRAELKGAQSIPVKQKKLPHETDEVSSGLRIPEKETPETTKSPGSDGTTDGSNNDDVHKLAADTVKDAGNSPLDDSTLLKDSDGGKTKAPYVLRESRVPSSRFGRLWQYSGLASSMAIGAVGESFRRVTRGGGEPGGSLMLSEGNMERLVAKLSKMRGAALKLGQMMSFQDSKMLPGPINDILQRVQDGADYMPASQRNNVLASNLGSNWQDLFSSFDEKPMAAASIGQVHSAILNSGQRVAVKVQYPGVSSSIDSDLSNLSILLTASRLLPRGLYLDKTIANARVELAWECDYLREAEMGERFRLLLADEKDIFHVPAIIKEASGPQVLTAEYLDGTGVTKVQTFTQEQRDWIGTHILRLCLREITEFKFMQTDPNWTNFLYNASTNKLELLDFGASRDYPDKFIMPYIRTLLAASRSDRAAVRDLSIELGYLTGHESKAMLNAHVGSVLTLAEPFADTAPELYDFRDQTITDRVRGFIPVMIRERLAPPPEETYSLHRKLSGAFLLCAKLGSRVRCREMFRNAMDKAGVA